MEEIIIKNIDLKPSGLCVIMYNGNRSATLNTRWQADEVKYLQEQVGVGGRVKVEITPKGEYINITKVDMTSGVKNDAVPSMPDAKELVPVKLDNRDASIKAQSLTKCACYGNANLTVEDVWNRYEFFLKKFSE